MGCLIYSFRFCLCFHGFSLDISILHNRCLVDFIGSVHHVSGVNALLLYMLVGNHYHQVLSEQFIEYGTSYLEICVVKNHGYQ